MFPRLVQEILFAALWFEHAPRRPGLSVPGS